MTADRETNKEFVKRARDAYGSLTGRERDRLFAPADNRAAFRGAMTAFEKVARRNGYGKYRLTDALQGARSKDKTQTPIVSMPLEAKP